MQYSFINCPTEIVFYIASELDVRSLTKLRLVCRELDAIVAPLALRNVSIHLMPKHPKESPEDVRRRLSDRTMPSTRICESARHLTVHSNEQLFRSVNIPKHSWNTIKKMERLNSLKVVSTEPRFSELHERVVERVFMATGVAGRHLKKLVLVLPLPYKLSKCIAQLRTLEDFRLVSNDINCNFRYLMFPCIPDDVTSSIQQLIRNNPNLVHISLETPCKHSFFDATKLFEGGSSIRSLHFDGVACPTPIPPHLHSCLRNLRCLTIRSRMEKVSLDQLWISLQDAQISLEHLDTAQASTSLLNYLSSFRGLKFLAIKVNPKYLPLDGTDIFFNTALMKHNSTLESLSITIAACGGAVEKWHYNPVSWNPTLCSMSRLTTLSLHSPYLIVPESEDFFLAMVGNYQEVITGVECISTLRCLTVCWSEDYGAKMDCYSRWEGKRDAFLEDVAAQLVSRNGRPRTLKLRTRTYTSVPRAGSGDKWCYIKEDGLWG